MADLQRLGNIATALETLAGITPEDALRLEKTEEAKLQRVYNALTHINANQLTALAGLSDVVDSLSPASGESLIYNGTSWTSGVVSGTGAALNLDDLVDVEAPSPTSQQVLAYNGTNSDWRPSSAFALAADLSAHTATSVTHGTSSAIVGVSDTQTLSNKQTSDAFTVGSTLTVSGEMRANSDVYVNYNGADGDSYLYFYDGSSPTGEYLKWEDATDQFVLSTDLDVLASVSATGTISANTTYSGGSPTLNAARRGYAFQLDNVGAGWARGFVFYNGAALYGGFHGYGTAKTNMQRLVMGTDYNGLGLSVNIASNTGFTGINTLTPSYELDVNGTINGSTDVLVGGESVALRADVQSFTANGTWTKPSNAQQVKVIAIGGGGGGGGGAGAATGDSGGGGGKGGTMVIAEFNASDLSASHAVVVGSGGSGGTGGTNAFGSNGTDGGDSTFGTSLVQALGGAAGSGGRDAAGTAGGTGEPTTSNNYVYGVAGRVSLGGVGGAGDDTAAGQDGVRSVAGGGGGGGGGMINGLSEYAGGAGGGDYDITETGSARGGGGTAGPAGGTDGSNGAAATAMDRGGAGGGGGGGRQDGAGGNGATGGDPGGGGGGGGAAAVGSTGGTGGTGGTGKVWVISYR